MGNHQPLVIAHRGASTLAIENSLESFEKAIDVGADMIEFDVRKTRDDSLIAFHDDTIDGRRIAEMTLNELRQLSGPERSPTLEDVIATTKGRIGVDVELKEAGYERRVVDAILRSFDLSDVVFTSFEDQTIAAIADIEPEVHTALLLGLDKPTHFLRTRLSELFPFGRMRRCHAKGIAPYFQLADLGLIRRSAWRDVPIYVWTVNDFKRLRRYMSDSKVSAVITDVPQEAVKFRA
jgi:glycerophosphoryl diester phosphodiesterase